MRWVAFSSIFAGITGYLVIFLATSTLGAERFDGFNVYWALFFAISGIVQGFMHETTRGVRAASATDTSRVIVDENDNGIDDADELIVSESATGTIVIEQRSAEEIASGRYRRPAARGSHRVDVNDLRPNARPIPVAILTGLALGALLAATSWWWGPLLLPAEEQLLGSILIPAATVLLAVQAGLAGLLSGTARWQAFGILLTFEAALRVAVAAIAAALGNPMAGFMYATVAGVIATPVALWLTRAGREVQSLRTDVPVGVYLRRAANAMVAASAAAVLVVGFPVILQATRAGTDAVVLSNLLLAVLLTRAPILTPITSFQNALVVFFVDRLHRGRGVLLMPVLLVITVGIVGAGLAWFLGPPIIGFMGDGFRMGGEVLATLTFAASLTGALYVTGSAVLARERHGHYVAGWWIASGLAIIVLLVVPEIVLATELALIIGPLAGVLYHVLIGMHGLTDRELAAAQADADASAAAAAPASGSDTAAAAEPKPEEA